VASSSSPRRPARPVSWAYSPDVSGARPAPPNLVNRSITTVRAGMLIPSDRVSVAKTAFKSPAEKQPRPPRETPGPCRRGARHPASRPSSHSSYPSTVRSSVGQLGDVGLGDGADGAALGPASQAQAVSEHLADGVVAGGAAEDEHDGRQERLVVEQLQQLGAPRALERQRGPLAAVPIPLARLAPTHRPANRMVDPEPLLGRARAVEEGDERGRLVLARMEGEMVPERDGPVPLDHHVGGPRTERSQSPSSVALLTVADRHTKVSSGGGARVPPPTRLPGRGPGGSAPRPR